MIIGVLFWGGLALSLTIGLMYMRDLGDVGQMFIRVRREDMIRFIRDEYTLLAIGLGAAALMILVHIIFDAGPDWVFWVALVVLAICYGFPYAWVHLGLRNQMNDARYYSIDEAKQYIAPGASVVVIENNGVARAHPDHELLRPHLAGNEEGLDGEDVVMTFCAIANLGIGYTPEIQGERLELEVLAQHGNNLIMRDNTTNEPIQQVYGSRERDGKGGPSMKPWPTFRMSFRGFQRAWPDGTVFLNKPSSNPLLRLFDTVTEIAFSYGIARQHREEKPLMDNMTHTDDRLPNKTYVWGIDIGDDAVCYTQEFLVEQGDIVNTEIGGRNIVLAWDPLHESLGAWYRPDEVPVSSVDVYGSSDRGKLERVETLKPGMFWHVWAEFFQHTEINRATQD